MVTETTSVSFLQPLNIYISYELVILVKSVYFDNTIKTNSADQSV